MTAARARLSALSRWRQPDDPELLDAQRDLAYEVLRQEITDALARTPLPLAVRTRLAALLGGGLK